MQAQESHRISPEQELTDKANLVAITNPVEEEYQLFPPWITRTCFNCGSHFAYYNGTNVKRSLSCYGCLSEQGKLGRIASLKKLIDEHGMPWLPKRESHAKRLLKMEEWGLEKPGWEGFI